MGMRRQGSLHAVSYLSYIHSWALVPPYLFSLRTIATFESFIHPWPWLRTYSTQQSRPFGCGGSNSVD